MSLIEISNLTKRFGKKVVLENVNLNIQEGKILGIIGTNGSGKTTLLNMLVGFYKPTKGSLLFQSKDIQENLKEVKRKFGFATQYNCFYPHLTAAENIAYFGAVYGLDKHTISTRTIELLKMVDLYEARDVLSSHLSMGMQRRLDIACSLIHDPEVLILDEPTEDLDPGLRRDMLALIKKVNSSGTTVILTSHLLSEVEEVCDRIAIIDNHTILKEGTVDQLRGTKHEEIHLQTTPGDYKRIVAHLNKNQISSAVIKEHKLLIHTEKPETVLIDLLRITKGMREKIEYIDVRKPSLAEVFEDLIEK